MRQRKTEYKLRERVVEIHYTREILRESESMYSDTSGSTWQSSGPPNYNLLHAVCYTTRTRGEEEDVRWRGGRNHTQRTHRGILILFTVNHTPQPKSIRAVTIQPILCPYSLWYLMISLWPTWQWYFRPISHSKQPLTGIVWLVLIQQQHTTQDKMSQY